MTNFAARLTAGPTFGFGPEDLAAHRRRLGPLPSPSQTIQLLEASGLLGRGGAGFPVGRKWRSVAERRSRPAVVLANGAEGEPISAKDRMLLQARPHLVLDGALLAAGAVGADQVLLYVGREHQAAAAAAHRAIAERGQEVARRVRLIEAPPGYVSGEETAAVHFVNSGVAKPTSTPPRPFERGVGGHATLVQNVESLATAALIARLGPDWYRSSGRDRTPGSALVTVTGGAARPGVYEIELGTAVGELATIAGGLTGPHQAVLLGGYFGGWTPLEAAWQLPLDPAGLRAHGLTFGCGVVAFLPSAACGVRATAPIISFMAASSAGQCGPCVFGLRAIAEAVRRIAGGTAARDDLERLKRWCGELPGRGACHHPDGAATLMQSALWTFGDEFALHQREGRCSHAASGQKAA